MPAAATYPSFPDLLAVRLRHDPGAPWVTYYDDASGERTELSVTSTANWVAKHANLWVEELDLEPGGATVLVDLPAHWLVPTLLGGAWLAGVAVTTDPQVAHDVVVTSAEGSERHAGGHVEVLACSLHPFALPATTALPAGVLDHGHLWPGQSDVFVPTRSDVAGAVGWRDREGTTTQGELMARASRQAPPPGTRLLTTAHPADDRGVPALLAPLTAGSVVYVRHPAAATWDDRLLAERVDLVQGQPPVA